MNLDELRQLEADEQLRYCLKEQKKMEKHKRPDLDITDIRHFILMFKVNAQAMWDYQPRVYPGRILFFRASEKDAINAKNPERAWFDLAQEGV